MLGVVSQLIENLENLCVGFTDQPLFVCFWIFFVKEQWIFSRVGLFDVNNRNQ